MRRVHFPINQPRRLNPSERQRNFRLFNQNRNEGVTVHPLIGFDLDPFGLDGGLRPDDDYPAGPFQDLLDHLIVGLSRRNLSIPPNRPALLFKYAHERSDAFAVRAGIAEKDVGHCHSAGNSYRLTKGSRCGLLDDVFIAATKISTLGGDPMLKLLRRSTAIRFLLAGATIVACAQLCLSFISARQSGRGVVIKNVRIFDGSTVIPTGAVIIEGGKIKSVGKTVAPPDGAEIIDGTGHTLLPGLIDSHTHAYGAALKQAVMFGVTAELDMFSDHRTAAQMRKEQSEGKAADRADLFSAGTLVTAPGGHGTEYGLKIPTITAPGEAQAFVDARIAEGSDYIKIVYDDGKLYGLNFPTVSKEILAAVIASAHKRGKLAVVHISTLDEARDAIEADADGLVHIFSDRAPDPEFPRMVAAHRAFVIPTLTVTESVTGVAGGATLATDPALASALSPMDEANLKKTFPARPGAQLSYSAAEEAVIGRAHV